MTMTITESCVERLNPSTDSRTPIKKETKYSVPYSLMRSASFDRLRQFPTYFCRSGSAEIYRWLSSSKTQLSTTFTQASKQLQLLVLPLAVFGSLGILAMQSIFCLMFILSSSVPWGFTFMFSCMAAIASLAYKVFFSDKPIRQTRSHQRTPRD